MSKGSVGPMGRGVAYMRWLAMAAVVLGAPSGLWAAEGMSARAVMERNYEQMQVKDGVYVLEMRIEDQAGRATVREVRRESYRPRARDEWSLVRFLSPADVEGTGLLSLEDSEGQDDVYLYLPELRKSRRISGSSNGDYFMGSDFTYKDLRSERLEANRYERLTDEVIGGEPCARIVAMPETEQERTESGYSRREIWVSLSSWLVVKAEFYDEHGDRVKTLTASDVREVPTEGSGKLRPYALLMVNHERGRQTKLTFSSIELNVGLPTSRFSKRALERAR